MDHDRRVSLAISRVFCVTLSTAAQPASQPQSLTMLLETAASTDTLTVNILDEVGTAPLIHNTIIIVSHLIYYLNLSLKLKFYLILLDFEV